MRVRERAKILRTSVTATKLNGEEVEIEGRNQRSYGPPPRVSYGTGSARTLAASSSPVFAVSRSPVSQSSPYILLPYADFNVIKFRSEGSQARLGCHLHRPALAEGQQFSKLWSQGGSVELGANLWRGLGIATDVTGTNAGSIGSSGIPLSMVPVTFCPRYRWHAQKKLSLCGAALLREANGFRSLFPTPSGSHQHANSMALQIGGAEQQIRYPPLRRGMVTHAISEWHRQHPEHPASGFRHCGPVRALIRLASGMWVADFPRSHATDLCRIETHCGVRHLASLSDSI